MTAKTPIPPIPPGKWTSQIPDFARRIGQAARARRVILFGSAARGDMGKHSDLDFLVVIPETMPDEEAAKAWSRAHRAVRGPECFPDVNIDIIVTTDRVIRRLRNSPYGPVKFAMDEGVEVWNDG